MSKPLARVLVVTMSLALVLATAACSSSSKEGGGSTSTTAAAAKLDYKAIDLWDDAACDASLPPLKLGLMTVFESPLLTLKDQATALEAAATAFNARGGANGSGRKGTTRGDRCHCGP